MRIPQSGLRIDSPAFPLLQALLSFWGQTDNDGNVAGTTIRCGNLALEPSYAGHALKILSGPAAGQTRDVITHPAGTDTITVVEAFSNVGGVAQQITAGTRFVILSRTPAIAEVAALAAALGVHDVDIRALLATIAGYLDTEIAAILAAVDTEVAAIETKLDTPANFMADLTTLETRLSAARAAFLDEAISAAKVPKSTDESGDFPWDTSVYLTNETDISALFTTPLTGTTRRDYSLYLDLTNAEADGAAWTKCTIKVKVKVDGANYRTLDKKDIAKTDVAAAEEPGVEIDIPPVAQDVQVTMQFDVALGADQTIYYHYVKGVLE